MADEFHARFALPQVTTGALVPVPPTTLFASAEAH
jgi:hypothetical protein